MKKILIHSIAFSPDGVSTAYLYNDIAIKFKEFGFEVSVLTTTPHYNVVESELLKQPLKRKAIGLYYESNFQGIKVKHVYQKKYNNTFLRLLGFVYWHIISFFLGVFEKNIDLIISPSPPLSIGIINIFIGKIKRAKVIYNVQEIYPDLLIKEGGLKSKNIINILKWMEKLVYNNSDAVTTIDEIFYNTILPRFNESNKLFIIPNFVDTDIYKPIERYNFDLDTSLFPQNKSLKLMYAGNIGLAQDWIPLINLASDLKNEEIEFFIIGEGVMKEYLEKEKKKYNLEKLHLISYQPRELMPKILSYSDLQFIFMSPHTEGHGFPSKIYTIMACAKPIMVCSGENTPIINFLKNKECAYLITDKNNDNRIIEMASILRNCKEEILSTMGINGYNSIVSEYSKQSVTNKYIDLVKNLLN